jgi:hypothetical protein
VKAVELIRRLTAAVEKTGRNVEVFLIIDDVSGEALGTSALHSVWWGEDVTETRMMITLSGTEGKP